MKKKLPNYKEIKTGADANGLEECSVAAADYAIKNGLDRAKVATPGTPEYIKYQQWTMSFSGKREIKQDALSKTQRPGILQEFGEFLAAPWKGEMPVRE